MAKTYKVTVELNTEATLQLFRLEGYVIALTRTLDNAYRISISNFPIEGELDYYVHCTGWNKTPWSLKISVDDKDITPVPIKGEIEKGYSAVRGSIKF
ncbi:hypothetical protein AAE02nite_50590 [Adhaeribacter aerolatus]|uniref:Uncharacterized protein n=1 Tax=Adhaeribacter aerolatus TaxID=670289 RepID=A0A512B606_9BACT|nr:hypothetical protein [Adhaeribacter aerolatus]GEO07395.1 hypothetical protein AAE02nite_50590 [Adhaeribacter aerolatus]